ncbi:pleckstrin homology domain-containing family G member 5-like isoform X4 [Apostichopus japonicus]|uniref:pleckstrin homology domain-containing family G member 5-like isoform X4 n=1 Tax=Stichopus japonicus TaxID=307972 RepID=UPI003AB70C54
MLIEGKSRRKSCGEAPYVIITRATSPGTNPYPNQKFPVACDDLERNFLDEGGSPNSQEKLEKPEKQDDGDYVYLMLKPPLRKEIAVCKEEDESSVSRSASVRSAPSDSRNGLDDSNGSLESPRLKRKSAIRRHSTFSNRHSESLEPRTHQLTRAGTTASPDILSRSADWRAKPRGLLDIREEYFTLNIELVGCKETVRCRVEQGASLRYVLSKVADDRPFDIDGVDVFVESSQTPFPVDTPTYALARRNLFIRANKEAQTQEPANQSTPNSRKTTAEESSSPAYRPNNSMADIDEINTGGTRRKDLSQFLGVNNPSKPPGNNRRLSVPGVQKNEKFDPKAFALQEKLDQFSIHGLKPFPIRLLSLGDRASNHDEEIFELEESWRKIVKDVSSMDKKEQDQMEAIWEIFKTENRCIKNLRIIIDLYMCTLLNLQASSLLNGIQSEKIFANIIEIEKLHITFWKDYIMKNLKKLRTEKKPLNADDIYVTFKDFTTLFTPYFKFCPEEGHCLELVRTLTDEPLFKQYLTWCEKRRDSERKKLSDLLVYPMQRLTKYPLLLSAVAKKTVDERMKIDIQARADEVDHFIRRINHEVTRHQEQCKLDNALARIEGYEGIHIPSGCEELSRLTEEYSSLDLSVGMPFAKTQQCRWLLYEGPMKIRDQESKFDVYVFLFTDAVVFTKPKKDKFKVIKPPMRIDRINVQELKDKSGFAAVCVNDYGLASYGFIATTEKDTLQKWLERISKAKELYNYACTEDTDDFLDNVSISQSSEPTDTSSGLSVEVETPTGSPTPSPLPSPKTPHRRVTTSMFENTPTSFPDALKEEEAEEDNLQPVKEEAAKENGDQTEPLARPGGSPQRKVPPVPMPRTFSEGDSKRTPPPISPKPTLPKSFNLGVVHERSERGSYHSTKYEQTTAAQTIMAYDSDDDEICSDPPSSNDPYINPDAHRMGRFKKNTPSPAKRHGQHISPNHSPNRYVSPGQRDVCKVNNHQLLKQCHVNDDASTLLTDNNRNHGDNSLNGNAAIISSWS